MGVPVKEKKSNIIDFPRQVRVKAKPKEEGTLERFLYNPSPEDDEITYDVVSSSNKTHNDKYMDDELRAILEAGRG